jgi:uncharacterized glyoxalase superfamily protein PhnB
MNNDRVADVRALLQALREEGCSVRDKFDDSEYGKFGWVVDPKATKLSFGSRFRGHSVPFDAI